MSLNLEKQLTFYGAYHHHPTNVLIHMLCVPLIVAASLVLLANTPNLYTLPSWLSIPNLPPNAATIISILYTGFYILLEPVAGTALLPLVFGWTAFSNHLISSGVPHANKIAIAVKAASWIAQFIGHGVFEKRAPALLDNLLQAFVLAPFFVFLEGLFKLGYRPELQKRVNIEVEKEVKKFRASKAASNGTAKNGKAQ